MQLCILSTASKASRDRGSRPYPVPFAPPIGFLHQWWSPRPSAPAMPARRRGRGRGQQGWDGLEFFASSAFLPHFSRPETPPSEFLFRMHIGGGSPKVIPQAADSLSRNWESGEMPTRRTAYPDKPASRAHTRRCSFWTVFFRMGQLCPDYINRTATPALFAPLMTQTRYATSGVLYLLTCLLTYFVG